MTAFKEAALELLSRRKAGVKASRLEASMRPASIDDALNIQAEMADLQTVGGWKCLLPPSEDKIIAAPHF